MVLSDDTPGCRCTIIRASTEGVVIDFADFYLPLLHGCENRGYKRGCGLAERKFGDHKSLVIEFLYFGAHFHRAATRAIVILRCVHQPTGLEIGKEREGAPVQTVDGRVENLVEVMRQNLGTEGLRLYLHPWVRSGGNFIGRVTGSCLRPS